MAVEAVNSCPELYRELLVEQMKIPPFFAKTYHLPSYSPPEPFSKKLYVPVMEWLRDKQLILPIAYEQMVDGSFIPANREQISR